METIPMQRAEVLHGWKDELDPDFYFCYWAVIIFLIALTGVAIRLRGKILLWVLSAFMSLEFDEEVD